MSLRLITLLLALVAQVSAQCPLCPGGQAPPNGDLVLDNVGTCSAFNTAILATATFCAYNAYFIAGYASICGCPGVVAGTCPGVCAAGTVLTDSTVLPSSFTSLTCQSFDLFAKAQSDPTVCADLQSGTSNNFGFDIGLACCVPAAINVMGMGMSMGMSMADMNTRQRSLQVGRKHHANGEHLTDGHTRGVARGM